ncbi:hypothetical protein HMPREF9130_1345 [Peptoniphilus sp. oral taxon 375 str. F0436]|nr:hypothetical protein HMPREF9130_1345 [Peptoniphilus sp. oral taxon 375 str. F0436]
MNLYLYYSQYQHISLYSRRGLGANACPLPLLGPPFSP